MHDARLPPGHVPGKCNGRNRQTESLCKNPAGMRTDHKGTGRCYLHGGCTPSHQAAAVREQAQAELARLDIPPVDDPLGELSKVTAQVVAWKDAMAAKVNELTSLRYEATGENGTGEQLRAEVALWERALDRCEKFLSAMARLNIDERLTKVTEKQAAMVEQALMAALAEQGMTSEQQSDTCGRMRRHLRAVS
jgi:hypothetical protein